MDPVEAERRALDLFEHLLASPGNARFRARLLKQAPADVIACLAKLEAGHAARAAMPTDLPSAPSLEDAPPPTRIGPFRLVERIGQGGMGDVWRGERDDGRFEQAVAIKLLHILGDSGALRAFDAERRILAKLDHPDIVRLQDGGETEAGQPYLIMDYVEGAPLDRAAAALPPAQRVELFVQAAKVVQFSHSRLIAHGDLKPSNILVDLEGRVRLLDFGVAALLTAEGAPPPAGAMTRQYASPERIAGAPPSVLDDVFALGRVLGLLIGEAGDQDLAAIVAISTAPDDADRYPTVQALIADLERWRQQMPVLARRGGGGYHLRKFLARHRVGSAAAAIAILALLGATTFATLSSIRAEQARQEAEHRFGQARAMAKYMLFDLFAQMSSVPGTTRAKASLAQVGQRYLANLAADAGAPDDVRLEAAEGFVRVAEIVGATGSPNLANSRLASENLRRATAMAEALPAGGAMGRSARLLSAKIAAIQCQLELYGDHDAGRALEIAVAAEQKLPASLNGFADETWRLHQCHGDALTWLNRTRQAIPILEDSLRQATAVRARAPAQVDDLRLVSNWMLLGEAYIYDQDLPRAADTLERGYALIRSLLEEDRANVRKMASFMAISDDLASVYQSQGRLADALIVATRAHELATAASERDTADMNARKNKLSVARLVADLEARTGDAAAARALADATEREWLSLVRGAPDEAALYRLYTLSLRPHGDVYRRTGDLRMACLYYRRAAQAWAAFDRRWGVSPSDRTEDVAYLDRNLLACDGKGAFAS